MLSFPRIAALLLIAVAAGEVTAAEPPSFEDAAASLRAATVTVRVIPGLPKTDEAAVAAQPAQPNGDADLAARPEPAGRVTVCSGVSLGKGLVVTYVSASQNDRIRITAPGGDQAEARLRVVDRYSGLSLLETDRRESPGLDIADQLPEAGAWIVSGAAWGTEQPAVSVGILAAANRSIPRAGFPPLLQCDLRTAETSSGGAVVDRSGKMIGVIVASDGQDQLHAWTYAVPVRHVQRLLRAQVDDKVVVLKRRRPIVGLVLGAGAEPETVAVQRVVRGGPADQAGLEIGDHILATDDTKIRSVYQALRPVLQKQPGDKLTFWVQRNDEPTPIEVTLGGGVELPAEPSVADGRLVSRRIEVNRVGPRRFDVLPPQHGVRNLGFDGDVRPADQNKPHDAIDLLEKALERYGALITSLQEELRQSNQQRTRLNEQIRALEAEVSSLRDQLSEMTQSKR